MMSNKSYSPNAINKYADCGKAYELRYIQGNRKSFMSVTMLAGKICERAIQFLLEKQTLDVDIAWKGAIIAEVNEIQSLPEGFVQTLVDWLNEDTEELFSELNKIAMKLPEHGIKYVSGVKGFSSRKTKGLFTNVLLKIRDSVELFMHDPATTQFIESIQDIEFQYKLEYRVPVLNKTLSGYSDLIVRKHDGSIACFDIKYSDMDYSNYNVNRDTQLFTYAMALKKLYPDQDVTIGFITPKLAPHYHLCDMAELCSSTTWSRLKQVIKGIDADIYVPVCGGGAYKDIHRLCEFKEECEFGSCPSKD